MQGPERATPPPIVGLERAVGAHLESGPHTLLARVADAGWSVLHTLGAHRWREGYETDLERGWSRYRGSRCAICDSPWEGW
jgi:hypothetical protein